MKMLTLRITDTEYSDLKQRAINANNTISGFIHDRLFPTKPNLLTVDRILERFDELVRINKIDSRSEFTISDLFEESEYIQYFNVIPIGKLFFNLSQDPSSQVYSKVSFVPNTAPAKYKKK